MYKMADLTIKQKKEWASMLYLKENLTQQEIAEKIGVSRQSLGKWIKSGKWDERKTGLTMTREEQIASMYRQVDNINKQIMTREEGQRFANSVEADIIAKLSNAIKKLEDDVGIADIISVGQRFIEWLRPVDTDKAKEMAKLWDAFIKDNI
jgi:predicted DNA-binding protein YlxM (UPF0122 family)